MHRQIASTGDVIDGRYRIETRLGKGGFARVYRATDLETGQPIALKLLRGGMIEDTTPVVRFMKEGNILARLGAHANVIQVFDAGLSEDEDPFIAMELLEGQTLTAYIKEEAPVAWDEALGFMSQVADGLEHVHAAGIIHRDLKPGNVLLTQDAHGVVIPKLVDFGIAKVLEAAMDQSVTRVGTPAYCAPEQLGSGLRRASRKVGITVARGLSPATDVWPFGLITYELLTGLDVTQYWGAPDLTNILMKSALEPREKPSKVAGDQRIYLPPEFDEWFMRCLEPNAADRFKTPSAAVDALADLLDLTVDDVPTLGPHSPQLREAERELIAMALGGPDKDSAAPTIPRPDPKGHRIAMDSTTTEVQHDESTAEITRPGDAREQEPSLPGITLDDDAAAEAPPVPPSVRTPAAEEKGDDEPELSSKPLEHVSEELSWGLPESDGSPSGGEPFSEELLSQLALDEESETPPSLPPSAPEDSEDRSASADESGPSAAAPASSQPGDGRDSDGEAAPSSVAPAPSDDEPPSSTAIPLVSPPSDQDAPVSTPLPDDWSVADQLDSSAEDDSSAEEAAMAAPPTEQMAPDEPEPPTRRMAPDEVEPPTRRMPSKSRRSASMVPYALGAVLVGGIAALVWDRMTQDPADETVGTTSAPAATSSASPELSATQRPPATPSPLPGSAAPPGPSAEPEPSADPSADPAADPTTGTTPPDPVESAPPEETAEPSAEPPPPPPPRPRWRPPPSKYVPPGI